MTIPIKTKVRPLNLQSIVEVTENHIFNPVNSRKIYFYTTVLTLFEGIRLPGKEIPLEEYSNAFQIQLYYMNLTKICDAKGP